MSRCWHYIGPRNRCLNPYAENSDLGLCEVHVEHAERVFAGEVIPAVAKVSSEGGKPHKNARAVCKRGHRREGENLTASRACRACNLATAWARRATTSEMSVDEYADMKYREFMGDESAT